MGCRTIKSETNVDKQFKHSTLAWMQFVWNAMQVRKTDAENAENSSGTETETEEQRRLRYYMAAVDEVSQPDLWEEIQADYRTENREFSQSNESVESEEARRRRYLFSERNEVSDTELYDAWVEEIMVGNRVTAYGESSEM